MAWNETELQFTLEGVCRSDLRDHWTVSMWSFLSFGIAAIAEAITGVKPDLIPEIVVAGIIVIVGVVGASGVSIWSLWPLTDF